MNSEKLLNAYRELWSNRELPNLSTEEETLFSAIKTDLKDEMTHPRLRRNTTQKFHTAVRRIINSSNDCDTKIQLIQLHLTIVDKLTE